MKAALKAWIRQQPGEKIVFTGSTFKALCLALPTNYFRRLHIKLMLIDLDERFNPSNRALNDESLY